VDNETLARLRSVYQGLTLGQRHYLKVIVESSPEVLGLDLCETLPRVQRQRAARARVEVGVRPARMER